MNFSTTFPFTQKRVLAITPAKKPKTYTDEKLNNLKLTVTTKGTKTYYARFKVKGQPQNIKLGNAEELRLDDARARTVEQINMLRLSNRLELFNEKVTNYRGLPYVVDDAFAAYFQNHLQFTKRRGSQRYCLEMNYTNHLKSHIGHFDVRDLNKKFLAKLLKHIGNTKGINVYNKCVTVLKAMFNYCLEYEESYPIEHNPAQTLKKLTANSRSRYLTFEEGKRLVEELKRLNHKNFTDLFLLALYTGARISNIKAMKWDEIIFSDQTWIVPAVKTKTNKTYCLPLSERAIYILTKRQQKQSSDATFVFPSDTSSHGHVRGGDSIWKQVIINAELYSDNPEKRVRQHDLRRTFATWQALSGVDINTISSTLGHSDIKNTQIYARINTTKARDAINLAFDKLKA